MPRRCATCKFEAFGTGNYGKFCADPTEKKRLKMTDPKRRKQYCNPAVHHGKCWCSDSKAEENTGFEQASGTDAEIKLASGSTGNEDIQLGTTDSFYGETPLDLSIARPVAWEAPLNPIDINELAAIDFPFRNLQASIPKSESFWQTGTQSGGSPNRLMQAEFEQNGLPSNPILSNENNIGLAPDFNSAFGRKRA